MAYQNLGSWLRSAVLGAALVLGHAAGNGAAATPITLQTFTFEQPNYMVFGQNSGGKLAGRFTGSLDSFGHIVFGTLTEFELSLTGFKFPMDALNISSLARVDYFDFNPGDSTSLTFHAFMENPIFGNFSACIGFITDLLCQSTARGALNLIDGPLVFAFSESGPIVTAVTVAPTPIPGALLLFGTAAAALPALAITRRRPGRSRIPFRRS
jgi:hypothetical protein